MSDTTSPSVHIHPISPSSSLSSMGSSGLHSELTSDEEPDLGAFTTVLREWTHLQPPPRIPVQIRSATSSTTPTFQPSVTGSELQSDHSRNSHATEHSAVSSFTRPPSSSAHPEGSTVWAHAPIASYLYSGTPSNDEEEGEDINSYESIGEEGEFTPYSMASTHLTVEIASETDFEESTNPVRTSPYPYPSDSGISFPLTLESDNNRLDSRETAHPEEDVENSSTTRENPLTTTASMHAFSQVESRVTSVQLQSQRRPSPTTISSSLATTMAPSATSLSPAVSDSPPSFSLNRSRNPALPRTTSDSSFTTSGSASSSAISLLSYQISETASIPIAEETSSSNAPADSSSQRSDSASMDLKTQRSIATSTSESTTTFGTQRPQQTTQQLAQRTFHPTVQSEMSSVSLHSPLPNPHSPLPDAEPPEARPNVIRSMPGTSSWNLDAIVNDLGTPDQPPSETLLFDPPRNHKEFQPIVDDDEEVLQVERHIAPERFQRQPRASATSGYTSAAYERPGPSISTYGSPYIQHPPGDPHPTRRELHNEDEDEFVEEEDNNSGPYTHSHGLTPRSIGPALTPRGIPPAPINSRSQQTMTMTNSHAQLIEYSNQQLVSTTQTTSLQQPLLQQYLSSSQMPPQFQTNQSNSNIYTTAPAVPAQSTTQQPSSNVPSAPPATQNSTANTTQMHGFLTSSQHPIAPRHRMEAQRDPRNVHGYPYSLLGLHALPPSIASYDTSTLPSASSFDSDDGINASQSQRWLDPSQFSSDSASMGFSDDNSTIYAPAPAAHSETDDGILEQAMPSLGVLDGVLSFIAVERARARTNAVREGPVSVPAVENDETYDVGSGEEREVTEGDTTGVAVEAEEGWKHSFEHEQEQDQPKRKRKRKRPPRAHATPLVVPQPSSVLVEAAMSAEAIDIKNTTTSVASPRKKKRSKSAAPSASASVLSLPIYGEGFRTPTMAKSRDKEFLLPPLASTSRSKGGPIITILQRPSPSVASPNILSDDDDDDASDFDGNRTPTNFESAQDGRSLVNQSIGSPFNLTGKKGNRVGRRQRENEKRKRDGAIAAGAARGGEKIEVGEQNVEVGGDDDDDDFEPKEDEYDEQGVDNDSLSNLSLLKPPPRRTRRRRAHDTTHIHTVAGVTGVYQSTPGTPLRLPEPDAVQGVNGDIEQSGAEVAPKIDKVDENNFEPSINEMSTPDKRKRTRAKRVKAARSAADLAFGAELGEPATSPNAVRQGDSEILITATKAQKGKARAAEMLDQDDVLDMDRNELQRYLLASGSGLVLMNSRPERNQPPPDSKRGRILTLARQLRELFPEQRDDLGRVISRIEKQAGKTTGKTKKIATGEVNDDMDAGMVGSSPNAAPGSRRRRSRKRGHKRAGSEGANAGSDLFDFSNDQLNEERNAGDDIDDQYLEMEQEEEEIDPRGRPPKKSDVLVHVFIDHSNILIGLLSHLKRNQTYRKNTVSKARGRPQPTNKATAVTQASHQTDPVSAFAAVKSTSSRPLPVPCPRDSNADQRPIPLPSFATTSHSLPTTSTLSAHMGSKDTARRLSDDASVKPERDVNSDSYDYPVATNDDSGAANDSFSGPIRKKILRHLWHPALALILERGRPITKRVVVTSSPLYQPMDAIERLGYELRVFIRVPDLGDGQDRERYRDKDKITSAKSGSGMKNTHSSPAGLPSLSRKSKSIGHMRHPSGNTSTESGSGGAGSTNTLGTTSLHPYYGMTSNSSSQTKVKFREQGVDELLQLKLHQALAATDDVPEGSTIVLATGDGNMGQFNEDGFLGPVRTALRRGWKVELYAWEDGLSRAWKREFGDGSEWGQRGLFRVIAMEQFADGLVETVA